MRNLSDFDRHFEETRRSIDLQHRRAERRATAITAFGIVWMLFQMGCLGAVIFLLGRWTGVW